MNENLDKLAVYPIQRLMAYVSDVKPNPALPLIKFSIGEPRHPAPKMVGEALAAASQTFGAYPNITGTDALRTAIANWIGRRYAPAKLDPATEIQAVNGTREGMFSIANALLTPDQPGKYVLYPNPGYAVYEGVCVLAGYKAWPYDSLAVAHKGEVFRTIPESVLANTALMFVCCPDNPSGNVQELEGWKTLFELSDRYGFTVVVDECYSEIYIDAARPPMGALQAAALLGRKLERLIVFSSLSKRSNLPGLRSGFVAGDPKILAKSAVYRSYNGGGMNPAVDAASVAAWNDEDHVHYSRTLYKRKYEEVIPMIRKALPVDTPDAGFFLWVDVSQTGLTDAEFSKRLYEEYAVLTMPGSYMLSTHAPQDMRYDRVRMALVADMDECKEGARRICEFAAQLQAEAQPA